MNKLIGNNVKVVDCKTNIKSKNYKSFAWHNFGTVNNCKVSKLETRQFHAISTYININTYWLDPAFSNVATTATPLPLIALKIFLKASLLTNLNTGHPVGIWEVIGSILTQTAS